VSVTFSKADRLLSLVGGSPSSSAKEY